ncbi:Ski complex subunit Rec14 [Ophidiomyces ophidiicola]|nr:Ski complex subunit Rec14 [Ophidiomyces ophidiicola]KAI1935546.1 Ski complex subunit Rec14 [Ophidiomyces ophidiicola]KAI1961020.1 Ski complex subunit Rec14 [Ophidiomyces ophidiicola]
MAAIRAAWTLSFPLPFTRALPFLTTFQSPASQQVQLLLSRPLGLSSNFYTPSAIILGLPSLLEGLWESILRAVPKKKTSHMKKRHRQMAGKALKDMKNVTKCPGCGQPKRAHLLCPTCVTEVKQRWREEEKSAVPA